MIIVIIIIVHKGTDSHIYFFIPDNNSMKLVVKIVLQEVGNTFRYFVNV